MVIIFLKDHCEYKAGDVVKDHPNAAYLVAVGVAKEKKSKTDKD